MSNIRFKDYLKDYLEYNNITNKDFANRIGITPKHLIDILSGERDLSSNIIESISIITNIPMDYIYKIESNYRMERKILEYLNREKLTLTEYLKKYEYKYLIKNKFIEFIDKDDNMEIAKDILKFLRVTEPETVFSIDSTAYYKSKNDKPELLLLWLEKCYRKIINQNVGIYKKENIDGIINYIRECAKSGVFDEEKLTETMNENGIYFTMQEDIPGSKIRGAFKVHRDIPAIYLTYKHKRIADIYFALLHELAHCKSDFNKAKGTCLVSSQNDENTADVEDKADIQAYNWMVEEKYYNNVCKSINYDINEETEYPKSFVLYRLAHDREIEYRDSDYQKYNFIINKNI